MRKVHFNGAMMYPDGGRWNGRPAPEFEPAMHYRHTGRNRPIRVYDTIGARFVLEDFYARLAQFVRGG
jgi:purine nucleosidase